MKVMNYLATDRDGLCVAWHEAKRQYIEQQVLLLKDEQAQPLANMCHYNGEALMRPLAPRAQRTFSFTCSVKLVNKP